MKGLGVLTMSTNPFDELTEMIDKAFIYTPMTGEQFQISNIKDTIEWAEAISGEWNGDESGSQEDRAHCADEIIEKLNEVCELILEMGEL